MTYLYHHNNIFLTEIENMFIALTNKDITNKILLGYWPEKLF
jgi:hypothetical protein